MSSSPVIIKVGTRSSKLAVLQTQSVVAKLGAFLPDVQWQVTPISSPGDRDLVMDLRQSPADFFTRDLDEKIKAGELDCAIHSAKDVPEPIGEGLDWFWLPWREDPRDALIRPRGRDVASMPPTGKIGVSSDRREAYCQARFPTARQVPIRGTIEERLRQLDQGDFDLIIMAGAALNRLGLQDRITEWIPDEDLPAPDGQGSLAVTFRAGDKRFLKLRKLFVKSVTFSAAGVGTAGACTLDGLAALQRCDICLHDTLFGHELMDLLPPSVTLIDVGKRAGAHSVPQNETTYMITKYARRGLRVVRLKGGDPGIFGRLAEEVEAMDAIALPYRVLPGVSSLSAATSGTGMLLTRRSVSRGFTVMTPRKEGGGVGSVALDERKTLPIVFFMATGVAGEVARQLIGEGQSPDTPAAVVFGAGSDQSRVITGTLATIERLIKEAGCGMAGLILVGNAVKYRYLNSGALAGRRILLTASDALQDKAAALVSDFGGIPVCRPLIRLVTTPDALSHIRQLNRFDWIVLTSPSAVRCFGELLKRAGVDLRSVPKLVSCGGGTSQEMKSLGLSADIEPLSDFSANGLLYTVKQRILPGTRILRLRSDKAGEDVAQALRGMGAQVEDCLLYRNEPIQQTEQPEFDVVFFASASAVEVFDQQWGMKAVAGRFVVAIGKPTLAALNRRGVTAGLVPPEATVESSVDAMALHFVRLEFSNNLIPKETR
ncbi:MAG: hydroxymethylbilane synthase [bacterium]